MPMGVLFWVLMVLWGLSLVGSWANWAGPWVQGSNILQLILFGLLGWKVFGPVLQ